MLAEENYDNDRKDKVIIINISDLLKHSLNHIKKKIYPISKKILLFILNLIEKEKEEE
jgi:hypothetical protein